MFDSQFKFQHQIILLISLVFLFISIIHFEFYKNKKTSLILLLVGTIGIKLFITLLSPYLYAWDEVFHGLVAKNMIDNPFYPTLYQKTIYTHSIDWWDTTLWIHKQPWFLWQMALSIKAIGATAFAVRLPILIYLCAGTFFIYDIGKRIANERVGFYGALMFCLNNYINEQLSGSTPTDHNDLIFMNLIFAGFWAFVRYTGTSKKTKYVILIGVFCGLAILTKWLVALIVFFCWFWYIILSNKNNFLKVRLYFDFIKSLIITTVIALPWQIYISLRFPIQAAHEFEFNRKHITEGLDGHVGDQYFYFDVLGQQFGYLSPIFCLLGIVLLYRYVKEKTMYITLLISFLFVYAFFTIVQTKMSGFVLVVSFLLFLGFGAIAQTLHDFLIKNNKIYSKISFIIIVLTAGFVSFNIEAVQARHTTWRLVEKNLLYMAREFDFKEICDYVRINEKDTSYVYYNCEFPTNINLMFETGFMAYSKLPDANDVKLTKEKGYKIAVINCGTLPAEIENNKEFKIISIDKFKPVKRDTCYLKSLMYGYYSNENNKLTCNSNKEKFIVTTFKDGTSQIKLASNNGIARITFDYGGLIVLDGTKFFPNERFTIEYLENNIFRIKTFQNKYLKAAENGERVIFEGFENKNEFKFFLSKD